MIKILLPLFFLLHSVTINAQQYVPLIDSVNVWTYTSNIIAVAPPPHLVQVTDCYYPYSSFPYAVQMTGEDTLVHYFTYKKLLYSSQFSQCLFGFIREDTSLRKVYFQDVVDSPEVVLYNFSMLTGDSITINFPFNTWSPFFPSGVYRLDSITLFNTVAGNRNAFHLNCVSQASPNTLTWIEGVGNLGELVYPYSANSGEFLFEALGCPGFPHNFIQFLTCFTHSDKVYFDSCAYQVAVNDWCFNLQDSCTYGDICGDVNELNNSDAIRIFPNPVSGTLSVISYRLNGTADEILICNMLGEKVLTTKFTGKMDQNNQIDISRLASGIYFLQIEFNDKLYRNKFVKE
jgi:hypothetical protein